MLQPIREVRKGNENTGEHLIRVKRHWEGQHLAAFLLIGGTFVAETKMNFHLCIF